MNITICGCGNGAHVCAALLCRKGHSVNIFSPLTAEVETFKANYAENQGLTLEIGKGLAARENGGFNGGFDNEKYQLHQITDDPAAVIPKSRFIIIIVPAFAHHDVFRSIKEHIHPESTLVVLPSRGGIEFEISSVLPTAKVVAFQTLPWACRIKKFGSRINLSGVKNKVQAAAMPGDVPQQTFAELEELMGLKIERLQSPLTLTLANVGQIFHPGIMYGLFRKNPAQTFTEEDIPLFYENVDEAIAAILSGMSDEVRAVAEELAKCNEAVESEKVLHVRDWLLSSYEGLIEDTSSFHRMFRTNAAYKGIKAPVKKLGDGLYTADFGSRYIVEDIPYGLLVTRSLAEMLGVRTPMIDEVLSNIGDWVHCDYLGKLAQMKSLAAHSRLPEFFGVHSRQGLAHLK